MTTTVIFKQPGIQAIGAYLPGIEYEVDDAEAARLISHKGFKAVAKLTKSSQTEPEPTTTNPNEVN